MPAPLKNLPILMGALRQEAVDGELVLEQNDGMRKLYLSRGELVHLKSDVAGEQFGNYLLRQGILDFPALNELLANDERYRLGEKVIQWGMMSLEERDCHLQSLQEQIMIHALEHPILEWTWSPGPIEGKLEQDLHFKLQHRHFIWNTFQESNYLMDLLTILEEETDWRWEGRRDLLDSLSDLPLTPGTAYALSFLGADPISFETFRSLSNLGEEEAGRFIASLWGLGALILTRGKLPSVTSAPAQTPAAVPPAPPEPLPPPMNFSPPPIDFVPPPMRPPPPPPMLLPKAPPVARTPLPPLESPLHPDPAPEFLELESEPAPPLPLAPPPPLEGPARAKKLVRKAKQLVLQDRTVEAVRALEQAVQFEPDADAAFEAWLLLGQLRLANPAWSTRSIDALQNASRIRPKAAEPWAAMGEVYHRKGFHANAVACFRKALELDPSVPVPQDIDLEAHAPVPAPAPTSGGGLFSKFRSILGRSEKP